MAFGNLQPQNQMFPPTGPYNTGSNLSMGPGTFNPGGGPISALGSGQPQTVNPDGSVGPTTAQGGGFGPNGPSIPSAPVTGAVANMGYSGAGLNEVIRNMPTALIEDVIGGAGYSPYGGLADILGSVASPDQMNTLYSLLAAGQGGYAGDSAAAQGNFLTNFYQGLMGSQQLPSLSSIFAPAFRGSGDLSDPFYGLLTGGTSSQQVSELLGAVNDISKMSMNPLLARALMMQLQRAGNMYESATNKIGGAATNMPFLQWLRQNAPNVMNALGG